MPSAALSPAHLMVSLFLCSSGSNAQGESRALEGCLVSSKSPSRVRDRDEGVARGTKEKCFPDNPGKSMVSKEKQSLLIN